MHALKAYISDQRTQNWRGLLGSNLAPGEVDESQIDNTQRMWTRFSAIERDEDDMISQLRFEASKSSQLKQRSFIGRSTTTQST